MDIESILANQYVHALFVFLGFFLAAKLFVYVSEKIVLRLTAKTKTNVDDLIVQKTQRPISIILILIGLRLALLPIKIKEAAASAALVSGKINETAVNTVEKGINSVLVSDTVQKILNMFIICVIAYIIDVVLGIFIDAWAQHYGERAKTKLDPQVVRIFHRVSKIMVYLLALLFILQHWGIQIAPLLASLGVAGIAVAFALQATLANVFGGIGLIMDRTIKVGDIIKLDTGESGVVHDIGIRSTKIKTWDHEIVTIPNGKLADSRITNLSQPDPSSRITLEFGVAYGTDPDKVKKVALNCLKGIEHILKEPSPDIWFTSMGDFALQFKLMFRVDNLSNKWGVHQQVITKLYKALNKEKITIPYPTHTVYMHKEK